MAAPTIYRSTDTNAPVLYGGGGSLITLLDACLINGYGSAFASGTVTIASQPADGDTVTIGSVTYTFRATLAVINDVKIGAAAANTVTSLLRALQGNGVAGTDYFAGTIANPDISSVSTASPVTVTARKGGTAGNSLALAKTGSVVTVSGATLTGGGGSDTKTSVGWTKPFTGANWTQACYRQAGVPSQKFYLQVDDSGPGTGGLREARSSGWETMTAYNTGTGQFPTAAINAALTVWRKSTTVDAVTHPWLLVADDRSFYLFVSSGDAASNYCLHGFGDIYSYLPGDQYKGMVFGNSAESASALTTHPGGRVYHTSSTFAAGHYLTRNYTGVGGTTVFIKAGDGPLVPMASNTPYDLVGILGVPNLADGGLYICPLRVIDASTPGSALSGTMDLRGRLRGLYHAPHLAASVADGDTFTGTGEYAGRSFLIVKYVLGQNVSTGFAVVETTAWDTSS